MMVMMLIFALWSWKGIDVDHQVVPAADAGDVSAFDGGSGYPPRP